MHPYASCFAHHCAAASICTTVDWRIPLYFSACAKSCSPMSCCQAARRTTFFQGIGEHMSGPTIVASSTMRPKWFSRGRICHSLRLSFCFSPSTQGQLPACCKILFVSPARLCFILRILTSHALTVVLLHTCPKKKLEPRAWSTRVSPLQITLASVVEPTACCSGPQCRRSDPSRLVEWPGSLAPPSTSEEGVCDETFFLRHSSFVSQERQEKI